MENIEVSLMYDDPYYLDDEPKITQTNKVEVVEVKDVKITLKTIEDQIYEDNLLSVKVPTNKEASITCDDLEDVIKDIIVKKPKKRTNVWTKTSTRKGNKKTRHLKISIGDKIEEIREIDSTQRYLLEEKNGIQLSKDQKAEKIELSLDKLQACSEKGYRMVRATRGVIEGAWYFEIIIKSLGKTGHTRLGWSTWKGDLQAPVGFDINSYAYRDVDGSKVHQALREQYGKPYFENDVIGFYINLPNGANYTPKYDTYVHKGSENVFSMPVEKKDYLLKRIPGSEISFFKNGVCQGVAFREVFGGEYFPAASMYTLPFPEKKCSVQFNFGPDYIFHPQNWGGRPHPQPMSQALPPKSLPLTPRELFSMKNYKEIKKLEPQSKANNMQQMVSKQDFGVASECGLHAENDSVPSKRKTSDERDKGKRIRVYGKKGLFGRGRRTVGLFPCPIVRKPRIGNTMQQKMANLETSKEIVIKNVVKAQTTLQEPTDSSDEETE